MTFEEWLALVEEHEANLFEIEEAAAAAVGGPIEAELQQVMAELARRYVEEFGSVQSRDIDPVKLGAIVLWLRRRLGDVKTGHVAPAIDRAAKKAWRHGVVSTWISIDEPPKRVEMQLSEDVQEAIRYTVEKVDQRIREAQTMVDRAQRWGDFSAAMGKANQAATAAKGGAEWVTNRAASDAVAEVEKGLAGFKRVWRSERTACVHCAAYAGVTALTGQAFPGGLTYDEKPISVEPVPSPPLHGHCRCRQELIRVDDDAIPEALKREARRSIAKGWSLESESEKTRLKAIEKLLAMGPDLPKTVVKQAEKTVRQQKIRSRRVPTGNKTA